MPQLSPLERAEKGVKCRRERVSPKEGKVSNRVKNKNTTETQKKYHFKKKPGHICLGERGKAVPTSFRKGSGKRKSCTRGLAPD